MDQDLPADNHELPDAADAGAAADSRPVLPAAVDGTPARYPTPANPVELELEFHGSAREYFRIWIVNLCLTLITLGVFSAWAKVRKKRYAYSHTTLGGTPFQYLARPVPILKGRILAAIGFGTYYVASNFVTSLLPYVLLAGLVAAPWVLARSAAFNARYSAYRNMTFHFDGTYRQALKTLYAWGIIPLLVFGMVLGPEKQPFILGLGTTAFGLYFPWWMRRLKRFITEHTTFGGKRGEFSATGGAFFKIYFLAGLIAMVVTFPTALLMGFLVAAGKQSWLLTYLGIVPMYASYVIAYAYIKARSGNLVWNHIRLGPVHFESNLRSRDLIGLYITNAIGILLSLGLLIPWAVIRTLKYRADHLRVVQSGTLYQFKGSDQSAIGAVGAETVDFFDMDVSL